MSIAAIRDYLKPGGLKVYYEILAQNQAGYFDISPTWLSERLTATNDLEPSHGVLMRLAPDQVLDHISELVHIGAVTFDDKGLTALSEFTVQVSDDEIDDRLDQKKREVDQVRAMDARITEALGPPPLDHWGSQIPEELR